MITKLIEHSLKKESDSSLFNFKVILDSIFICIVKSQLCVLERWNYAKVESSRLYFYIAFNDNCSIARVLVVNLVSTTTPIVIILLEHLSKAIYSENPSSMGRKNILS